MKFDKFMDHCFRILCLVTALVVAVGLISSCGKVKASAEDLGMFYDAKEFYHTFTEQLEEVTHNAAQSINDSNLPQNQKDTILKVLAMQEVALHAMNGDYDGDNVPSGDTVTIAGSCYTGFYYYKNELKSGIAYPLPTVTSEIPTTYTLYSCPDFQISYTATPNNPNVPLQGSTTFSNGIVDNILDFGISGHAHQHGNITVSSVDPFRMTYGSSTQFNNVESESIRFWISSSYIPTITTNTRVVDTNGYTGDTILGNGSQVSIPEAEVDSEKPWDYYNNYLLPEIQNNFPDVDITYICFPEGYQHVEPTEPPSLPNGGITINQKNNNFNIGINIIVPTDSNGQPITDTNGETVTETAYITDTSPVDGQYNFQMPTLPSLNVSQETIPPPRLSDFSDGLNFIWTSTSNVLEESGFLPAVVCVLSLCVLGYILWHIGG